MDRFTELMQDLGIHVAGVLNPDIATTPPPGQGGLPSPPVPSTGGMAPWQGNPAINPSTLNRQPAQPQMPAYDPTGPSAPAQPRVIDNPPPQMPAYDPTAVAAQPMTIPPKADLDSFARLAQVLGVQAPTGPQTAMPGAMVPPSIGEAWNRAGDQGQPATLSAGPELPPAVGEAWQRAGSPGQPATLSAPQEAPPAGDNAGKGMPQGPAGTPVGDVLLSVYNALGLGPSQAFDAAVGSQTQGRAGMPPQAQPAVPAPGTAAAGSEASRQGNYGPATTPQSAARGTTGTTGAPGPATAGAPSSAGPGPSVSGTGPAAPPPAAGAAPQARVQDALTPKGDRFGMTPRTYQLLGVIGATLMMGQRPGESPMAAMGRAVGAGMMYDNFARGSDQEAASNERVLSIKEKQLGLEGVKVGQSGQMTAARIAQIKADIANDTEKLKYASNADERAGLEAKIRRDTASIGLDYARPMADAELAKARAQAGKPGDTQRAQLLHLIEKSKNYDGTTNWPDVARAARVAGLGSTMDANERSWAQQQLSAAQKQGAEAHKAMREKLNQMLVNGGKLPEL